MCLAVYLASDEDLPTIPWCEAQPALYTETLDDLTVSHVFTKSFVVYVGSHEGCGCGFRRNFSSDPTQPITARNPDEEPATARSMEALAHLLQSVLASQESLELYSCWEGDQSAEPLFRKVVAGSVLQMENWFLQERELLTVVGGAA